MPLFIVKFTIYIVLAFIVGAISQFATGYRKLRLFTTTMIGIIGVFLGDKIASWLHLPYIIKPFYDINLIWSLIGAIIFIVVYRLIRGEW